MGRAAEDEMAPNICILTPRQLRGPVEATPVSGSRRLATLSPRMFLWTGANPVGDLVLFDDEARGGVAEQGR